VLTFYSIECLSSFVISYIYEFFSLWFVDKIILIIFRIRMSVTQERIEELNQRFLDFMSKPDNVEIVAKEMYEDLLDEVLMGFVFDVHRTTKTGSSDVEEGIPDDESYAIVGT